MDEPDWWSILRALDEPLPPREPLPPVESFLQPINRSLDRLCLDEKAMISAMSERPDLYLGRHIGWEVPSDFDRTATQARFDRLAERLSAVYHIPLVAGTGPLQDAALFGDITIPSEATKTRTKRTRVRVPLLVKVSNFGGLATYLVPNALYAQRAPVHPEDRERIEEVLTGLGYLVVPEHVLATRYDGPNSNAASDMTWYIRFFDYL